VKEATWQEAFSMQKRFSPLQAEFNYSLTLNLLIIRYSWEMFER